MATFREIAESLLYDVDPRRSHDPTIEHTLEEVLYAFDEINEMFEKPTVSDVLAKFADAVGPGGWTTIGAIAVGRRASSRSTLDIDILCADVSDIANRLFANSKEFVYSGRNQVKLHATGTEIDLLGPENLNLDAGLCRMEIERSEMNWLGRSAVPIPSAPFLIYAKLVSATSPTRSLEKRDYDVGDLRRLLAQYDLEGYEGKSKLSQKQLELYERLRLESNNNPG
jgi:hypothetical protein